MENIANPHDKLFKEAWSNRETAQDFLQQYLPREVLELVDLNTLEISKDSFVEKELKDYFSDLLYNVSLKEHRGYIYILFEHKSHPEKLISLQLLEYMLKIWRLHLKQHSLPLPAIIPLVLYHGPEKWTQEPRLSHLLSGPQGELSDYVPDFTYILYDLSRYADNDIKGAIFPRVVLLLFKYVFHRDFERKLPEVFSLMRSLLARETGLQYLETVLRYVFSTAENITVDELKNMVEQSVSKEGGDTIMTLAERLITKGIEQGIEQGVCQGLLEGIELGLSLKFGAKGLKLMPAIEDIKDSKLLKALKEAIKVSGDISELEAIIRN